MRRLVARGRPRGRVEVDSAGTGGWHVGDPPDERATAAARRRGIDARGRRAAGRARRTSTTSTCSSRWTAPTCRDLRALAPDDEARGEGAAAARVRPARRRRRPRRARPLLRRRATASSTCSTWSRRACRGLLDELRAGEPSRPRRAAARPRVRSLARAIGGGDINDAYRVELERRAVGVRQDRARTSPPGEYAAEAAGLRWLADAGGAARARACWASATTAAGAEWVERRARGAATRAALGARARARPRGRRARVRRLRRRRADSASGRSRSPTSRPRRLARVLRRAPAAAAAAASAALPAAAPRRRARDRAHRRPRRPAGAARAPARRPLERQRAAGPRRARRG